MTGQVKAFRCKIDSVDGEGITFSTTASKARYHSYLSAKDAGFQVRLPDIKITRAPEYDCRLTINDKIPLIGSCFSPEYLQQAKP